MKTAEYSYYEEMLEVFKDTEWNDETAFFLLGRLSTLYTNLQMSYEEYKKLFGMIPLSQKQIEKINY